jgi:hypothetical protein
MRLFVSVFAAAILGMTPALAGHGGHNKMIFAPPINQTGAANACTRVCPPQTILNPQTNICLSMNARRPSRPPAMIGNCPAVVGQMLGNNRGTNIAGTMNMSPGLAFGQKIGSGGGRHKGLRLHNKKRAVVY